MDATLSCVLITCINCLHTASSAQDFQPCSTDTFHALRQQRHHELELELIQTQMAQKPMLGAEVGMRVRCANKASAE